MQRVYVCIHSFIWCRRNEVERKQRMYLFLFDHKPLSGEIFGHYRVGILVFQRPIGSMLTSLS